jgi:Asp-tRNA(Asn)/Glu-tRNA(Gln) amidotransferase A subunit family amidase
MQVLGRRWEDALVLQVAAAWERIAPWTGRGPASTPQEGSQ